MAQNAAAAMDTAGNVGGITPDGVYFIRNGKLTYYRYDELGGGGGTAEFPPGGNIGDVLVKTGENADEVGWSAPSGIAIYPISGTVLSDKETVKFSIPSTFTDNIIFGFVTMSVAGIVSASQPVFNFNSPAEYPLIDWKGSTYTFVPSFVDGFITLSCEGHFTIANNQIWTPAKFPVNAIFTLYLAVKESVAASAPSGSAFTDCSSTSFVSYDGMFYIDIPYSNLPSDWKVMYIDFLLKVERTVGMSTCLFHAELTPSNFTAGLWTGILSADGNEQFVCRLYQLQMTEDSTVKAMVNVGNSLNLTEFTNISIPENTVATVIVGV